MSGIVRMACQRLTLTICSSATQVAAACVADEHIVNLRPLETIDRGFIAFTTTNPAKRYARMANVKSSNNLRDFYYRDIVHGGQKEQLYEPTNNGEIEFTFIRLVSPAKSRKVVLSIVEGPTSTWECHQTVHRNGWLFGRQLYNQVAPLI